jgi:hypothetical protein
VDDGNDRLRRLAVARGVIAAPRLDRLCLASADGAVVERQARDPVPRPHGGSSPTQRCGRRSGNATTNVSRRASLAGASMTSRPGSARRWDRCCP